MKNPDNLNKNLKEGTKPWTKESARTFFIVFTVLAVFFCTLAINRFLNSNNAAPSKTNLATSTTKAEQNKPVVNKPVAQKKTQNNSTKRPLTPEQKVENDLINIVITNVLDINNPKLDNKNTTFKHDIDDGSYTVGGIVTGVDQTGKKVEYDFSAYVKPDEGDNIIQWTTENASTYKVETGTVDTSNGAVIRNN